MLKKDTWQVILTILGRSLRTKHPKQWDALKRVNRAYRDIIKQIEDNDKLLLYCDVKYPTSEFVLQEQLDQIDGPAVQRADSRLVISTTHEIITIRQLGCQPTHYWAPLLVCDKMFQLHLYDIHTKLESPPVVCTYQQHKAKLTAAISLGEQVVTADANGFVGVWTPSSDNTSTFFRAHQEAVTAIDYISQDLFVTCGGTEVKFWKTNSTEPLKTVKVNGAVKDIRAKSIDEFCVLTVNQGRQLKVTLHTDDTKVELLDYSLGPTNKLLLCDELRMITPQKVAGVIHNICKGGFQSVDCSDSAAPQTISIEPRNYGHGFFSRAGFCGVFIKQDDEGDYRITLSVEPTTIISNIEY